MAQLQAIRNLVDQTLSSLFPPERVAGMTGTILVRVHAAEGSRLECDLYAPSDYVPEIISALQSIAHGKEYTLIVRTL
jgi:hypothetical protein